MGDTPMLGTLYLVDIVVDFCNLSAADPLTQFSTLHFEQLKDHCFIFTAAPRRCTQITDRCIRAGFQPKINISSSKINMIMQMTAKGKGICILPHPYAKRYPMPGLKLVPIEEPFPWTGCLVKNKSMYQTYVSQIFEAFVMDYFKIKQL